jgi:uncharacterized membrane protein
VAFYSLQALLIGIVAFVVYLVIGFLSLAIPGIQIISFIVAVVVLIIFIMAIIKSQAGEWWEMPVVGAKAREMVGA